MLSEIDSDMVDDLGSIASSAFIMAGSGLNSTWTSISSSTDYFLLHITRVTGSSRPSCPQENTAI